jgi:hypothetical protein
VDEVGAGGALLAGRWDTAAGVLAAEAQAAVESAGEARPGGV